MKYIKRTLCVLAALAVLLGMAGCVNKRSEAVNVDGFSMSAAMYVYQLQQQKSNYLTDHSLTETDDLWNSEYDDVYTIGEYIQTAVVDNFINTLVWRSQFEKLGLSFDADEQKSIDDEIAEMEETYGGKSALEKMLSEYDLTYDEYVQSVIYDSRRILKIVDYYYGETGLEPVSGEDILDYFKDNYVRVKHVLISTTDASGTTVTGADMTAARDKAQSVYEKAKNADEAGFDALIKEYNEDEGAAAFPEGYLFTTGEMVTDFEQAAFDMAVGETRLVQSEYGFHIMRKLSLEDEDIYTEQVRQRMLLQMKTVALSKMVGEWRAAANVNISRGVLSKYTCNSVPTMTATNTSTEPTTEDIAGALGLTEEDRIDK